ncbi:MULTISPECIES: hypothetical protein [unclassified Methylobacterium]|uniref:hypothetical protein n=1 Tax=unclassified Methylobacterium TaxID=2615210 RepID=UPI00226A786D|nr:MULTISPECIES: hypothetical protein [unclassified Methylobacterium]
MTNGAKAIIEAIKSLKEIFRLNGLSDRFFIEFDDYNSGKSVQAFIADETGVTPSSGGWPSDGPEYKLICRDQVEVMGARIRWPIQSMPGG